MRVDVDKGERDMPKEGFAHQPEEHGAVLANRPQHAQVLEVGVCLAQNEDAGRFQPVEMIH